MDKIYTALQDVGVQAHLKGFYALHDAIWLVNEDMSYLDSAVGRLYPDVAQLHRATPGQTERVMRHAIGKAIDLVDDETLRRYFGQSASKINPPTVTAFIAALALHCREEQCSPT